MATCVTFVCVLLNFLPLNLRWTAERYYQNQLDEAVIQKDPILAAQALEAGANPNHSIDLTATRLDSLRNHSKRLAHYFAEEKKATPLILAAALGESDLCNLLIQHGANRFEVSEWGWVAAQYAAKCGYPKLARTLFETDPRAEHYEIQVDIETQMVTLLKDGAPVVEGSISTGRPGYDTPPGIYIVTDKIKKRRSTLYKVPMPYFLRLSFSTYGIHLGVNPGRPASHGCIRVGRESIARDLYDRTPIGTLVTIN